MEKDKYAFFKSKKKSSKNGYIPGKNGGIPTKMPKPHLEPIPAFNTNIYSMIQSSNQAVTHPPSNILVVKNGKYEEWIYEGHAFRPYFAGNFWISDDAQSVFTGWLDRNTNIISQTKPVSIKVDDIGRFVEVKKQGQEIKTYLNDAMKVCFPKWNGATNGTHAVSPTVQTYASSVYANSPSNQIGRNVTLAHIDGLDYAFYHEPLKIGAIPFWASKSGGKAGYMYYSWAEHTHRDFIPYYYCPLKIFETRKNRTDSICRSRSF